MPAHKKEILINVKTDLDSESKSIITKLIYNLKKDGFHTSNDSNSIQFKRAYKSTTNKSLYNVGGSATKVLRQGEIKIEEMFENKIKLKYKVSIDYIIFWSIIIGIFAGIAILKFYNTDLIIFGAVGLCVFLINFSIGFIILRFKINELIKICT